MEDNIGYIYILENEAMPELWKIGCSERENIYKRMKELYTTGVPFHFELIYVGEVENYEEVEDKIKEEFKRHKPNRNREFYTIEPKHVIPWLKDNYTIKDVTERVKEEYDKTIDRDDKEAVKQFKEKNETYEKINSRKKKTKTGKKDLKKGNRPKLNFKKMGLIGKTIICVDKNIKAKVIDEHLVKRYGKEPCSLNKLTLNSIGSPSGSNLTHWKYKNNLLSDIYDKTYGKKT